VKAPATVVRRRRRACAFGFAAGFALGLAGCAAVPRGEPANLDPHKREVRAYVESGEYARRISDVAAQARAWIEQRATRGGAKLTAVFDLDETLLSNWPLLQRQDFGYVSTEWVRWVEEGRAPAIEPVREVFLAARRAGVEVVLITGRRERDLAATERNLRAIGCGDYEALLCLPDAAKEATGSFKTAMRARLEREGRVIIANLGDQESDFEGGHAERAFKLPNPFYQIR